MNILPFDDLVTAEFSPCRTWRYILRRRWGRGPAVGFILLNPSTADEKQDDPTIRRTHPRRPLCYRHGGGADMTPTERHARILTLSKNLYDAMVAHGWRIGDLARESGIDRDKVSAFMLRQALPDGAELDALARALAIPAAHLTTPTA